MLRAQQLVQHVGRMFRGCKGGRTPFAARRCANENSPVSQAVRGWLYKHQTDQTQKSKPKCFQRQLHQPTLDSMFVGDFFYPDDMPDYTLDELKNGRRPIRISKALKRALDPYAADPKTNPSTRFSGRDPMEVDPNSSLGKYLRSFMESDSPFSRIYNIDFYTNLDADDGLLNWDPAYLDPYDLAYIFDLLRQGIPLTAEQLEFLLNALRAMANMSPNDLAALLEIFARNGLLGPEVLKFLRSLLNTMALDPTLKKLLFSAFNDVEHFLEELLKKKRGWAETLHGEDPHDHGQQDGHNMDGYNVEGYDDKGFNKSGYDRYGYDQQGFVQHKQTDYAVLREARARLVADYKRRVTTVIDRVRANAKAGGIAMQGVDGPGYLEPWDAKLEWSAAQELVQKAKSWRRKRLNRAKFQYRRGLEKYLADLQKSEKALDKLEDDMTKTLGDGEPCYAVDSTECHVGVFNRNHDVNLRLGV